jgi:hypothetical protein
MILDGFIALLAADPGVHAVAAARVYKDELPRGYTFPAVVVHRYGGLQDYDFAGPVGVREDQIQIDAYAETAAIEQLSEAIRAALVPFVGALPDGTVVQACYLERDMDMPFLPNANTKGIANRSTLGFRVVSARV